MSTSKKKTLMEKITSPLDALASASRTTVLLMQTGEVKAQNLLASTLLDGYKDLLDRHGDDVAEKLQASKSFYDSLDL